MSSNSLLRAMKQPSFYNNVKNVELIQTHISYVFLTGDFAYKIKKPVNFAFLDFSTLKKRKYFCQEEIRLNKRLCPNIYLNVVKITKKNSKYYLDGEGEAVEYAVMMRQFKQEKLMNNLLEKDKINKITIEKISKILFNFYKTSITNDEISSFGEVDAIEKNIIENFKQTENLVDVTINKKTYDYIMDVSNKFLTKNKDIFNRRILDGKILDCHGDLHSGNIVVENDKIHIFDCIEFNKRFRFCDCASDIGYLAMDLDYQNKPFLSSYLIEDYIERSNDYDILKVLNFYKSYRAYVRGKVLGFMLSDKNFSKEEKKAIIIKARKYFDLSKYYASLIDLQIKSKKPLLLMLSGLTGTGKSTIASKLSIDYNAKVINTDVVRKQIAGILKFEQQYDKPEAGLYSPENIDSIYSKVIKYASDFLNRGENVILDATFQRRKHRNLVKRLAQKINSCLLMIQCFSPDKIVKIRLEKRLFEKTASDGRWEIYQLQTKTNEPFENDEKYLKIDTSKLDYDERMHLFNSIFSRINEDIR